MWRAVVLGVVGLATLSATASACPIAGSRSSTLKDDIAGWVEVVAENAGCPARGVRPREPYSEHETRRFLPLGSGDLPLMPPAVEVLVELDIQGPDLLDVGVHLMDLSDATKIELLVMAAHRTLVDRGVHTLNVMMPAENLEPGHDYAVTNGSTALGRFRVVTEAEAAAPKPSPAKAATDNVHLYLWVGIAGTALIAVFGFVLVRRRRKPVVV